MLRHGSTLTTAHLKFKGWWTAEFMMKISNVSSYGPSSESETSFTYTAYAASHFYSSPILDFILMLLPSIHIRNRLIAVNNRLIVLNKFNHDSIHSRLSLQRKGCVLMFLKFRNFPAEKLKKKTYVI